jgi:nicotinamidase-related amidase
VSSPALPLPAHFDPRRVGTTYRVPYAERAKEAAEFAAMYGVRPAAGDARRVGLLLVDVQNTFCNPDFELFVAGRGGRGAVQDSARICEFVYRNLGRITQIVATLDTHSAAQIFHPVFWIDGSGGHPDPHTIIGVDDVAKGRWRINPALAKSLGLEEGLDLDAYARHYVRTLADGGKYPLTIWPYHAMLGGLGYALVSAVEEALFFHGIARQARTHFEVKGTHALTEHYSALKPEVMADQHGRPLAAANAALLRALTSFDALIVAGQAKSHCVAWTLDDLLNEMSTLDAALARKVYLLDDCSSPVVVPGVVDYTDAAEAAFERFAAAGMQRVRSTDPLETWLSF